MSTITLTISAGAASGSIAVTLCGDTIYEAGETFTVTLSSPGNATISSGTGTGTITNDDTAPGLSINDVTQDEGDSGSSTFTFTVTKSGSTAVDATADYATANGTTNPATAGSDYTAASGSLTFQSSDTTKTISVTVSGDTAFELDETFFVNLSNAGDATLSDSQGLGTISNDDPAPTTTNITSDAPDPSVVNQSYTVAFTVTIDSPGSGSPPGSVTVSDGSATCSATIAVGSCSLTSTLAGTKTLTATYAGDASYIGSSDTETHTVAVRFTTAAVSCSTPVDVNQGSTCTAAVTDGDSGPQSAPAGTVAFSVASGSGSFSSGSCTLGSPTANSQSCSVTFTPDTTGTHSVSGSYTQSGASSGVHAASSGT
ncbi:MAG: Ig-like domain repeat protein, partial [Chloroflexi bacterium]|nr:Ig-like domain repeat protein [Chloroflexota bacterium]